MTTSSPPISFALRSTRQERRNFEPRRASGYSRGTVSTLWLNTSGRSAITRASGISSPRKSGVSTSTFVPGDSRRIERITPTNALEPRSGRSSRSTLVITAWRSPIFFTDWATRSGSSGSLCVGLPVLTLQKPQRRVQVSPRIMKVAVPRSQQSPMLGQAASWQTVCSPSASSISRRSSR